MLATVRSIVNKTQIEHGPYEVYSLDRVYGNVVLSNNGKLFLSEIENVRLLETYKYKLYQKYHFSLSEISAVKEALHAR